MVKLPRLPKRKSKETVEPEAVSNTEAKEADAFVDEILSVQTFLSTYDINRTSNLDTLLVRAKARVVELSV